MKVVDELREVLDGVNVMVRGRRDERDTRLGSPQLGNVGADLGARQLTSLTY